MYTRHQCHVPAHVILLAQCSTACLVISPHVHNTCMWFSHNGVLCSQKHLSSHSRNMVHSTLSLMTPPSLRTSSHLTCTPTRPSTRPSTGPLQISSSDEIYQCDNPINVSFGSLADLHSPRICVSNAINAQIVQRCKPRLKSWQWRAVLERIAHRGRMWKLIVNEQYVRRMWEHFNLSKGQK